jgi:hypothetical protein
MHSLFCRLLFLLLSPSVLFYSLPSSTSPNVFSPSNKQMERDPLVALSGDYLGSWLTDETGSEALSHPHPTMMTPHTL